MIAVIRTGGKQYVVKEGQRLKIEKLPTEVGKSVTFDDVLLVSDNDHNDTQVGTPKLSGAKVTAKVVDQGKSKKVTGVKFHNKVRYTRWLGHRQHQTTVKIDKITA